MGREGGRTKRTIGGNGGGVDDKIERTLTSSFCKPHKQRTVRGSSSDWHLFGDDERWKRRSPLREKRKYV